MPHVTVLTLTPAMRSASRIAATIDRLVSSMSRTMPRRTPAFFASPTPSTLASGRRGSSPTTSAITAHVLVLPRSSPATIWRSRLTPPPPALTAPGRLAAHHYLAGEAGVQLPVGTSLRREILRYQHHGPYDLRPGVASDQHAARPDFQEHATARESPRAGDTLKQRRIHRLDQRQHRHHSRIPARDDRQVEARARRVERQRVTRGIHRHETSPGSPRRRHERRRLHLPQLH